ncbi:type II toxin-antitoxin system RelE/ParE family toxin [uncultured Phascolarctobacterium sp.]|nr:type II toxin-antitoxin system RelE/ParE family toxin [uncultured Phascolarctobacterium sp.]
MKTYEVQITQEALQDLELIYDYIATKLFAPQAAEAIYNSLTGAILSLDCFPER